MNRTKLATAVIAALGISGAAHAEGEMTPEKIFAKENFTANIALTTDYRFRGISNSDGVAVQGGMDWGYNGFFLGGWASNTEFSDANVEVDVYGGYTWGWSGLDFTVQGLYYMFPGESPTRSEGLDPPGYDPTFTDYGNPAPLNAGVRGMGFPDPALGAYITDPSDTQPYLGALPDMDANYFEVNFGVAKTFSETYLSPSIGFDYNFSPDFFGEDGAAHHFQISTGITLPFGLSPYFNVGYQDVEGDEFSAYFGTPDGYNWWWLTAGVSYDVLGFTLDVAYHWVDRGDACGGVADPLCQWNGGFETFYNNYKYGSESNTSYRDLANDEIVFTISRSF
ncbi:MAG: hypothetical protein RL434_547 [Pseudomonadota bacterium]